MIISHKPAHHFTVDVEEYFQVSALAPYVSRTRWETIPGRVELGVRILLDMLAEHRALGTFFVLGWIAERVPGLVREIAAGGHEVGSHGSDHRSVTHLSSAEFRESVRSSKTTLEDITGRAVFGYRAPNFSIVRGGEWALEILVEEGYRYDSSLFPVRRRDSGYAGGERKAHRLELDAGPLDEVPPATIRVGRAVLPAGGGAYFRHLPYALVRAGLKAAEDDGVAGTFYIHPWELDPKQPRIAAPLRTRLRHYGGLRRTVPRLERLLTEFRFQPIAVSLGLDYLAPNSPDLPAAAGE